MLTPDVAVVLPGAGEFRQSSPATQMGHWTRHGFFGTMSAMNLPPDAEIVVNRLGEPIGDECFTVLVIRTPGIEVEAHWNATARMYWIHAFALHRDGKRSHTVAVREAPHIRGVLAIVAGLVRRQLSTVES